MVNDVKYDLQRFKILSNAPIYALARQATVANGYYLHAPIYHMLHVM
jgi:hypothetical protein